MGYGEYPRGSCMDVTQDDAPQRFLAQHSITALLRHCLEWLQHCSNITTLCCAENRRCKSFRVTSSLVLRTQYEINGFSRKTGSFCEYRSTDYVIQKKQKTGNKTTPNKD